MVCSYMSYVCVHEYLYMVYGMYIVSVCVHVIIIFNKHTLIFCMLSLKPSISLYLLVECVLGTQLLPVAAQ